MFRLRPKRLEKDEPSTRSLSRDETVDINNDRPALGVHLRAGAETASKFRVRRRLLPARLGLEPVLARPVRRDPLGIRVLEPEMQVSTSLILDGLEFKRA